MSGKGSTAARLSGRDAEVRFEQALSEMSSNLWGWLRDAPMEGGCVALTIRQQAPGEFLVIAKRYSPGTGRAEVCFGTGEGIGEALRNIGKSMSGNKWYPDKYANGGGNGGG